MRAGWRKRMSGVMLLRKLSGRTVGFVLVAGEVAEESYETPVVGPDIFRSTTMGQGLSVRDASEGMFCITILGSMKK